ncbi:uncharacterized protein PG998_010358 [Apiospora kogelbergensis]|uniref:uncharacterized protein n=1 Tax=Apiospora kogelbergensis TaxID=1337665 RepID=UPI00312D3A65
MALSALAAETAARFSVIDNVACDGARKVFIGPRSLPPLNVGLLLGPGTVRRWQEKRRGRPEDVSEHGRRLNSLQEHGGDTKASENV